MYIPILFGWRAEINHAQAIVRLYDIMTYGLTYAVTVTFFLTFYWPSENDLSAYSRLTPVFQSDLDEIEVHSFIMLNFEPPVDSIR